MRCARIFGASMSSFTSSCPLFTCMYASSLAAQPLQHMKRTLYHVHWLLVLMSYVAALVPAAAHKIMLDKA